MAEDQDVDDVYIYVHGGPGTLYFKDSEISNADDADYSFDSLHQASVSGKTYLLSCYGGDSEGGIYFGKKTHFLTLPERWGNEIR